MMEEHEFVGFVRWSNHGGNVSVYLDRFADEVPEHTLGCLYRQHGTYRLVTPEAERLRQGLKDVKRLARDYLNRTVNESMKEFKTMLVGDIVIPYNEWDWRKPVEAKEKRPCPECGGTNTTSTEICSTSPGEPQYMHTCLDCVRRSKGPGYPGIPPCPRCGEILKTEVVVDNLDTPAGCPPSFRFTCLKCSHTAPAHLSPGETLFSMEDSANT